MQFWHASWLAMGRFNRQLASVRELVRTSGTLHSARLGTQGAAWPLAQVSTGGDPDSIASALWNDEALLVTLINLKQNGNYSDLLCALQQDYHWDMQAHLLPAVNVSVPPAMLAQSGAIARGEDDRLASWDAFELVNATVRPLDKSEWALLPGKGLHGTDLLQLD